MKVRVLFTGKTADAWIRQGIEQYVARIRHYVAFELVELPDLKQTASLSEEQIKIREGELILKALRPTDHLVLLDDTGPASALSIGHGIWSRKPRISRRIVCS